MNKSGPLYLNLPAADSRLCYNELWSVRLHKGPPGSMATKPAFAQSAQVEHPKFGFGSVLSCNEEYIVIKFDDHG